MLRHLQMLYLLSLLIHLQEFVGSSPDHFRDGGIGIEELNAPKLNKTGLNQVSSKFLTLKWKSSQHFRSNKIGGAAVVEQSAALRYGTNPARPAWIFRANSWEICSRNSQNGLCKYFSLLVNDLDFEEQLGRMCMSQNLRGNGHPYSYLSLISCEG